MGVVLFIMFDRVKLTNEGHFLTAREAGRSLIILFPVRLSAQTTAHSKATVDDFFRLQGLDFNSIVSKNIRHIYTSKSYR